MADVLIERSAFLASLEGLLGDALDSSGRLVFLGGEAGVGKTTLAAALADTVSADTGSAHAGVAGAAARPAVRHGSCDNVTTAEALGPILDALPELAAAIDRADGVSRLRLFRQVRDELSASPMLLLLEDVHWADEATLDILRFLGRRLTGTRLMILATFRSEEVGREHPLTVVMGELAGRPGVVRMQLPPFSVTGVRQLLDAAGSALDAAAIFQLTGGNPFYVTEVIAAGSGQVPGTVRDAVLARVSRLSAAGREVAAAASVLGRRAEADLLAAVSGQPLTAVDDCVERGVLVVDEDVVGFRHDLARLAVERSLPSAQRSAVHARTLAELTSRGSHDHRRLAYHAAGCGDQAAVAHNAPLAAARAARLGAHREAAEQFQLALRHHERPDRTRAALLQQLSYECYLTDQLTRARDSMLAALAIYEQERDRRQVGASQRWLSRLSWLLGQNADSERYAAAAVSTLEPLEPGPELAMAYSNLAQLRMLAGEFKAVIHWGTRAIELARRLGDRDTEMHALNNVGTALASADDMTEGCTRLTQSLDLALALDAHEHAARAFTNLGSIHILNWSLTEAARHLEAGIAYCADRDLDTWRRYMSAWLARSLAGQGQYAAAERHLNDILRHPPVSPITQVSALPVVGVLASRHGRDGTGTLDEALAIAVRTGESLRLVPVAAARAEAAWIAGRPGDLVTEIDRAWDAAAAHPQPWEIGELSWWLHLAGERRPARTLPARPFALMLAGEHRAAAAEWESLGCPLWSAYALAFSPEIRDAQRCLDLLVPLGVPAVRHAVLRDRHARGLAVPRGPRPARRASPAGLTARETEVLELLADGLSYAEVAERLVLSQKTVGHHVSAVLRKLREPTRSRAVATAQRLGVIPPRG
jgi:DNA-binding CsgD family transcriptional regulator/tetratricopeptide (TPR) repeat protein